MRTDSAELAASVTTRAFHAVFLARGLVDVDDAGRLAVIVDGDLAGHRIGNDGPRLPVAIAGGRCTVVD